MKYIGILIILFTCSLSPTNGKERHIDERTQRLLEELDDIVARKHEYHNQRNEQIAKLREQAQRCSGLSRIQYLKEIYVLYSHYRTDSAQVYLDQLRRTPEFKTDLALQAYVGIGQAEILSVTGVYAGAEEELKKVDKSVINTQNPDLFLFYLRTQRTLYGWMAAYVEMPQAKQHYNAMTQLYRDSLLLIEKNGVSRNIVMADNYRAAGNAERAVELLKPYVREVDARDPNQYIYFTLTQAYQALNNPLKANYYLTLTSITDLKCGTTEYQALPMLAQVLYEAGDVERAYRYLICSMEDANMCHARLRAVAVSNIFPIINKQYKLWEKEQRLHERLLNGVLAVLLVMLSVGFIYMRKQMKRLHESRQQQSATNEQLTNINRKMQDTLNQLQSTNQTLAHTYSELQLADKVKEEYIARYLDRCRSYLDAMDSNRHSILRMIKEHKHDELYKQLKSGVAIKEEQDKFYADFDAAFLTLFPDFIEKFNALLKPDAHIHPKHEGQLTTELRIFALIRLGITETGRIAHFLNFSLATVYNYRSKLRNRSLHDPNLFEEAVCKL